MSDDKPVPETLETIAGSIRGLRKSMDEQFAKVDTRFDELKAQLRAEIEAVRGDVQLVAEAAVAQEKRNRRSAADHKRFKTQLEEHAVRILALEPKAPRA